MTTYDKTTLGALKLVVDNRPPPSKQATDASDATEAHATQAQELPSKRTCVRHPSRQAARWVASAKTLPELHQRLGYLIRRKRI
jgi:hypothetical protein